MVDGEKILWIWYSMRLHSGIIIILFDILRNCENCKCFINSLFFHYYSAYKHYLKSPYKHIKQ